MTWVRLAGLGAAIAASAALLTLPDLDPRGSDSTPVADPRRVEQEWPRAGRRELPARLPDGTAYSPVWFLDVAASLGTAPSPDGRHLRLLLRAADGTLRELRRLPLRSGPQYEAVTVAGDDVAWAESVTGGDGRGVTEVWTVGLGSGQPPRRLTAHAGDVLFVNSRHDLVIEAGRVWWVTAARQPVEATSVRSVALAGGQVEARTVPGAWTLSAWPWLVAAGTGETGPIRLRNLLDGTEREVTAGPDDLLTCGPSWCRALVLPGNGPGRVDLLRPDGRDRHRVGGHEVSAALVDVAVDDRFEVLFRTDPGAMPRAPQLLLHDIARRRSVVVADQVGLVLCRGDVLWWSTGEREVTSWHTLDLGSLS